jgi:Ca2+-binding EF-hand superfamily protein
MISQEKIEGVFKLIDGNADGFIEQRELIEYMNTFGPTLSKEEEARMMEMVDLKDKGSFNLKDFTQLMTKKIKLSTAGQEVLKHFEVFDTAATGVVRWAQLDRYRSADWEVWNVWR